MPSKNISSLHDGVAAWAKRCYLTGRAAMEVALRPHSLGATQWYVLHQLAVEGPIMQRDLLQLLQVERATLSAIITVLVRRGLIEQVPDQADQRQKLLRMTPVGLALWQKLPDLTFIREAAFGGLDAAEVAIAVKVLRTATERLSKLTHTGVDP